MKSNITFTIIKPDAVEGGKTGLILARISDEGFRIVAMKFMRMTIQQAGELYSEHTGRPYFEGLVSFMSSGPVVVAILEKVNAVQEFRKLIGVTDPEQSETGTIRKLYGTSMRYNAIHGSDSDENAAREASFFFSQIERFQETEIHQTQVHS